MIVRVTCETKEYMTFDQCLLLISWPSCCAHRLSGGKRSRKKAAKGQIGKELLWWPARILQLCALLSFDLQQSSIWSAMLLAVRFCSFISLHWIASIESIETDHFHSWVLQGSPSPTSEQTTASPRSTGSILMRYALHEPFLDPAVVLPWAALMSLMHMTIPAPENLAGKRERCWVSVWWRDVWKCPQETWKMLLLVALCHFLLDSVADLIDPAFKAAFLCSNPWHWHILDDYGTSKKQWRWNEITRMPLDQFIPWWSLLVITAVAMINAESMNPVKRALGLQAGRFDGGPLIWSVLHLWQICVTKYFFHFIIFDLYLIHFI